MSNPEIPQWLHARDNHPLAPRLRVFVDDVEQSNILEYNVPLGRVVRYRTKDGEIVVDREEGEGLLETLHGVVTVELRDE